MKNLRTHGKSAVFWLMLGFMVLGLGGYGVRNFSAGGGNIGSVGDTDITADDYARGLRSELNSYSQQAGQPFTMEQARAIGLPQAVQARLFAAATLAEEARRIGISVGDERVARTISEAPAFKSPAGQFDRTAYGELLRREGLSESAFEQDIREDEARVILQRAVASGVPAPAPLVDRIAGWMLETRDFTWRELHADALPQPVADPDETTLQAWHSANAERFTAPETRKITYAWLTPEMLADSVELDEAALRAIYDERKADYHQPERRMVSRLVFPDMAAAEAARARLDSGELPFEALVIERGLTLDDIDLGELTRDQLGGAADAVFALAGPGIAGPVQTDLGPALFSMNAILDPVDVTFEQALPELRTEAAADRARRTIEDRMTEFEDLLASGATLEELVKDTPMKLGQIDWTADAAPEAGSIVGYPAFRERAAAATETDFPQLFPLDDGGVFALRLDEIVPPALRPFEEVRAEVLADWRAAETHRQLLELAEEQKVEAVSIGAGAALSDDIPPAPVGGAVAGGGVVPPAAIAPAVGTAETGQSRDGFIEGLPGAVLTRAFAVSDPGMTEVVDADGRVFLVTLNAVHAADLASPTAQSVRQAAGGQVAQSLQGDVFDYYARAVQARAGLRVNQSVIDAVNAKVN